MAILNDVPGIEVTVLVAGTPAVEYEDPHASESDLEAESPIVTNYIESISDAEFAINIAVDNSTYAWDDIKHCLHVTVKVDGGWQASVFLERTRSIRIVEGKETFSKATKKWYRKNFKFSAIGTVANNVSAPVETNVAAVKDLGLINVSVERHVKTKYVRPKATNLVDTSTPKYAEKVLKGKAISHTGSFAENKPMNHNVSLRKSKQVKGDTGPIAVFNFKFRSQECLKQELVIPRTPSPSPSPEPVEQSIKDMSIVELQRLAQERLDQIKWAQEAKRRNKPDSKRRRDEVIDVDEEDKKTRAKKRSIVAIDLTDD